MGECEYCNLSEAVYIYIYTPWVFIFLSYSLGRCGTQDRQQGGLPASYHGREVMETSDTLGMAVSGIVLGTEMGKQTQQRRLFPG